MNWNKCKIFALTELICLALFLLNVTIFVKYHPVLSMRKRYEQSHWQHWTYLDKLNPHLGSVKIAPLFKLRHFSSFHLGFEWLYLHGHADYARNSAFQVYQGLQLLSLPGIPRLLGIPRPLAILSLPGIPRKHRHLSIPRLLGQQFYQLYQDFIWFYSIGPHTC